MQFHNYKLTKTAIKDKKGGDCRQESKMKNSELQFRTFNLDKAATKADQREVVVSFSSEEPYERWFGTEVLSHDPDAVDLGRLNKGGAVLLDHDPGAMVGVIKKAWVDIEARKARAVIKFSKSTRGREVWQDVSDGIRQSFSVGYRVHRYTEETTSSGETIYRAVRWEPFEISSVAVPADTTVGVGRSYGDKKMKNEKTNIKVFENLGAKAERGRIREILAYGEQFDCAVEAKKAVDDGTSVDAFRKYVLANHVDQGGPHVETGFMNDDIGMPKKDVAKYRITDAIRALADPNFARSREGGLALEASQAVAKRLGREPKGLFVPEDVLKRDLTVGTDTAGGYLVGTDHLAANFVDVLRNRLVVVAAGAQMIDGLVGNVDIPKKTASATAYWIAGDGADQITESQPTLGSISMSPHTVAGFTEFSHKLIVQSAPGIEQLVRQDLADTLAVAIDLAALAGSGASNQPTGILNATGISSNTYATGGSPAWSDILDLEGDVASHNADAAGAAYITTSAMRKVLKAVHTNATYGEIPVWQPTPGDTDRMNGYRAFSTEQMTAGYILFGDFSQLIIGRWNAIEVQADPYSKFTYGTVGVRAMADIDIAVRRATAFAEIHEA